MTTSTENSNPSAKGLSKALVKEPILTNWIIIVLATGVLGFAALLLKGN